MFARLRQRLGPVGYRLSVAGAIIAVYLLLCVLLKGGFASGLTFALNSVLYMLPFITFGAIVVIAVREGYLKSQIGTPLLALTFALIVGVITILWAEKNPFKAYGALLAGSLGSLQGISETLVTATPLILTGLAIAFAFRCGMFNIGAEGQFIMGQMGAAWAGFTFKGLPMILHLPLTLLCGTMGGALWASVPGFLKAKRGVHEVINSIMMNYIALYLTHNLVTGVLMAPGQIPVTPAIADSAKLFRFLTFINPTFRVNLGLVVALLAAWLVYLLLWKTTTGYEIRAVGINPHASRYAGINVSKSIMLAMVISGALAGTSGAVHVMGIQHKFVDVFSFIGYGFDGMAVALLGNNHPAGVVIGALLFGALSAGSSRMQLVAGVPKHIVTIIQAFIVFFVAAELIIKKLIARRETKSEFTEAEKEVAG
jgi:simple sugar transport system permease protein